MGVRLIDRLDSRKHPTRSVILHALFAPPHPPMSIAIARSTADMGLEDSAAPSASPSAGFFFFFFFFFAPSAPARRRHRRRLRRPGPGTTSLFPAGRTILRGRGAFGRQTPRERREIHHRRWWCQRLLGRRRCHSSLLSFSFFFTFSSTTVSFTSTSSPVATPIPRPNAHLEYAGAAGFARDPPRSHPYLSWPRVPARS